MFHWATAICKAVFLPGIKRRSVFNSIHRSSIEQSHDEGSLIVVAAVTSNSDSEIYLLGSREMAILCKFTGGKVTESIQVIFFPCDCYVAVGTEKGCLEVWKISNKEHKVYAVSGVIRIPCLAVCVHFYFSLVIALIGFTGGSNEWMCHLSHPQ